MGAKAMNTDSNEMLQEQELNLSPNGSSPPLQGALTDPLFPRFPAEDPPAHAHTSPLAAGCPGACAKPLPRSRSPVRRRSGLRQAVPPEGHRAGLFLKRRLETDRNQLGTVGMSDLYFLKMGLGFVFDYLGASSTRDVFP